jgi:NADH:ubiquinone oxidoreductase subunit E
LATQSSAPAERVDRVLEKHLHKEGSLMPALQDLQKEFGWLSPEILSQAAKALNIPPSKVYGVASFYTLFATEKKGRHIVRICENAPCHVLGAPAVIKALENALGISVGETTPDGEFTIELTSCLGVCGVGPVIDIDGEVYGNLTPQQIPAVLKAHLSKTPKEVR